MLQANLEHELTSILRYTATAASHNNNFKLCDPSLLLTVTIETKNLTPGHCAGDVVTSKSTSCAPYGNLTSFPKCKQKHMKEFEHILYHIYRNENMATKRASLISIS